MPLTVVLKLLEDQARCQGETLLLDLDRASFRRAGLDDPDHIQIIVRKREYPILIKVALREMIADFGLTYGIAEGRILISTPDMVRERVFKQAVNLDAREIPMRRVLKRLADLSGVNVVLDSRVKEEPKITAELNEISLNTAVRTVAELAELKAVLLNEEGFLVTTKERAEALRKEQREWAVPVPQSDAREETAGRIIGSGVAVLAGRGAGLKPKSALRR
jgi:hypothetical protein